VKQSLAGLSDDAVRKIVHGNAARVYHLDETR
jgi:predicted TIM-barrel fold metal-dependent hydrolase